jgi:hypothetical protein
MRTDLCRKLGAAAIVKMAVGAGFLSYTLPTVPCDVLIALFP